MRTLEYRSTHVPAFLTKLWKLVTDPTSDNLISWSLGGTSFIIFDEIRFAKDLLPMYFKHNNMASFVRQLNMYGFRKLSCIEQGGMHCVKNEIEFYHQYFIKGQESLLELIKRKIPTNKSSDEPKIKQEYINELISNIKSLQGKQETAEQGMRNLKRENKLLWRQLTLLNGRYLKQHAMLQQLLPFFLNMVHPNHGGAIKRKAPLMIHESESQIKYSRTASTYFVEQGESDINAGMASSPDNISRGPVIHDVTEMEGNKMFTDNILCTSNGTKENEVIVDSPLSASIEGSDHAVDSPYVEAESMESLNILNCNFESVQRMTPPVEILPVSGNMSQHPGLINIKSENVNVSNTAHSSQINGSNDIAQIQLQQRHSPGIIMNSNSGMSYITASPNGCGNETSTMSSMMSEISSQQNCSPDSSGNSNNGNTYIVSAASGNYSSRDPNSFSSSMNQRCSTLTPDAASNFGPQIAKLNENERKTMSSAMSEAIMKQQRSDNSFKANVNNSYMSQVSNHHENKRISSPVASVTLQQRCSPTVHSPRADESFMQAATCHNGENDIMSSTAVSAALQQGCTSDTSQRSSYLSQTSNHCSDESEMLSAVLQQRCASRSSLHPTNDATYMQQATNLHNMENKAVSPNMASLQQRCSDMSLQLNENAYIQQNNNNHHGMEINVVPSTMSSVTLQQRCSTSNSSISNANVFLSPSTSNFNGENHSVSSVNSALLQQQQQQKCSSDVTLNSSSYSLPAAISRENMSVMDLINKAAEAEQNCSLASNNLTSPGQSADLNWLSESACGNDQNIENWLRQLLKPDNVNSNCNGSMRPQNV